MEAAKFRFLRPRTLSSFVPLSVVFLFAASSHGAPYFKAQIEGLRKTPLKNQQEVVKQLRELQTAESQGALAECQTRTKQLWKTKLLRGWIAVSYLKCANALTSPGLTAQKLSTAEHFAILQMIGESTVLLEQGAWVKDLDQELHIARMNWLRSQLIDAQAAKVWARGTQLVEAMMNDLGRNKDRRSEVFYWAGEIAQFKNDLPAAADLYELSLSEKEVSSVRDRFRSVLNRLQSKSLGIDASKETAEGAASATMESRLAEGGFDERFKNSQKSSDSINFLEDLVAYLNAYPNGRQSKWASDKAIETLSSILSRGKDELWTPIRERALVTGEKAEASRLVEWARVFHRRGEWETSLRFAEKALLTIGDTALAAIPLYIAGRSAQFLADHDRSQKYFEKYSIQHGGGEDLSEVVFRLGMTYLRKKDYGSAIAVFERVPNVPGGSKYELWARYWLVRALQKSNNSRAQIEADRLAERWPFSFYGIRLNAEKNQQAWLWPNPSVEKADSIKKSEWTLPSLYKENWERIEILSMAQWSWQAMAEIQELPIPQNTEAKALLAERWAGALAFPIVIRLLNQAGDSNTEYRNQTWVRIAFPKAHQEIVEQRSKEYGIQSHLIWSLIRQESAFHPRAISTSNAMGLMQLIPPTAKEMIDELKLKKLNFPDDVYRPEINIQLGTHYFSKLLKDFKGNVAMALAGYNAGPHRLKTFFQGRTGNPIGTSFEPMDELWIDELPWFETSYYVKAILRNVVMYQALDQGRVELRNPIWNGLVLSLNSREGAPAKKSTD